MSASRIEIVREIYNEWAQGNLRPGGELFDPKMMFVPDPRLSSVVDKYYVGAEGMRSFMHDWMGSFTDLRFIAEEIVEVGDSVLVTTLQRGAGRESGAASEIRLFEVWTFRAAKVIRREQFETRDEALAAIGADE